MVGKPIYVVPFLKKLNLPEEDGSGIERRLAWESSGPTATDKEKTELPLVLVVAYPHTAIADDICPLERDPRFRVQWRRRRIPKKAYPHVSAIILPGSRVTRLDLKWLNDSGWGDYIRKHVAKGGSVLGLCGGYQMLGWSIEDPSAVEGSAGSKQGLGLLPIDTTIAPTECRVVTPRKGTLFPSKMDVEGFELHCGQSRILEHVNGIRIKQQIRPLLTFDGGRPEGMCSGRVRGTYLHGILGSPEARVELLVPENDDFPALDHEEEDPLDRFAEHLESCGLTFDTVTSMMANQVSESDSRTT
jgi:adenosylcobyric acid synthase